jgi:hypothetical protein
VKAKWPQRLPGTGCMDDFIFPRSKETRVAETHGCNGMHVTATRTQAPAMTRVHVHTFPQPHYTPVQTNNSSGRRPRTLGFSDVALYLYWLYILGYCHTSGLPSNWDLAMSQAFRALLNKSSKFRRQHKVSGRPLTPAAVCKLLRADRSRVHSLHRLLTSPAHCHLLHLALSLTSPYRSKVLTDEIRE